MTILLFPCLAILAALFDVATMKIPNWLNLAVALLFFPVAWLADFSVSDFAWHGLAGAAILAVCFGLFALNIIGGGDAKLAAAIGLWLDPSLLLHWALWTAIYGGLLTVVILLFRVLPFGGLAARWGWFGRLHDRRGGVPYGVALAAAAIQLYPFSKVFAGLGGMPLTPG
jgi:prepilin peptidase CpaA